MSPWRLFVGDRSLFGGTVRRVCGVRMPFPCDSRVRGESRATAARNAKNARGSSSRKSGRIARTGSTATTWRSGSQSGWTLDERRPRTDSRLAVPRFKFRSSQEYLLRRRSLLSFRFRQSHFFQDLKNLRVLRVVVHPNAEAPLSVQLCSNCGNAVGEVF